MPKSRDDLYAFLADLDIAIETLEHPAVFTVEESQKLRGEISGGHTKNLFLKDKKDRLWLVVAREDAGVDLKRFHTVIGSARLSFGKADLLREVLGVEPGSVTPFSVINDSDRRVTVVLDVGLLGHDRLNFHPLANTATTTIGRDDFLRFLNEAGHEPLVVDLGSAAE